MTTELEADPNSINGGLADYLGTQKEAILTEWRERVRADKKILATRSLNTAAITNHLPEIFDDLVGTLRFDSSHFWKGANNTASASAQARAGRNGAASRPQR